MKPITDTMRDIRRGQLVAHATDLFAEVVRAVDATQKTGEIVIKITVKPAKDGSNQKTISGEVKAKRPEISVPESIFFSDADGNLHRTDPNQAETFADASERKFGA